MKCLKHIWPFKRTYTLLKSTDLWRLLHYFRLNSNSVPASSCLWLRLTFWAFYSRCTKQACLLPGGSERRVEEHKKGQSCFIFFSPWIICAALLQTQMWDNSAAHKWLRFICSASAVCMAFLRDFMKPEHCTELKIYSQISRMPATIRVAANFPFFLPLNWPNY